MLAKKEAALTREKQKWADERKRQEEDFSRRLEKYKKYDELETNKPDPIALLQRFGYSYQDATNFVLNGNQTTPDIEVKRVRDELEQYKKTQTEREEQRKKEEQERLEAQKSEAVQKFKSDLQEFVSERPEEYELTNLYEQYDLVFDTINKHWEKQVADGVENPKVLSAKEAAEQVEKYMEELVEKAKKAKKWAKIAGVTSGDGKDAKSGEPAKEGKESVTLTNSMVQGLAPSSLPAQSEYDRIQRALKALE